MRNVLRSRTVRYIPAWMPGAGWKRAALHTRKVVLECQDAPYRMTRDATVSGFSITAWQHVIHNFQLAGRPTEAFVSKLVEEAHAEGRLDEEAPDIRGVAGSVYAGTLVKV